MNLKQLGVKRWNDSHTFYRLNFMPKRGLLRFLDCLSRKSMMLFLHLKSTLIRVTDGWTITHTDWSVSRPSCTWALACWSVISCIQLVNHVSNPRNPIRCEWTSQWSAAEQTRMFHSRIAIHPVYAGLTWCPVNCWSHHTIWSSGYLHSLAFLCVCLEGTHVRTNVYVKMCACVTYWWLCELLGFLVDECLLTCSYARGLCQPVSRDLHVA